MGLAFLAAAAVLEFQPATAFAFPISARRRCAAHQLFEQPIRHAPATATGPLIRAFRVRTMWQLAVAHFAAFAFAFGRACLASFAGLAGLARFGAASSRAQLAGSGSSAVAAASTASMS